MNTAATTVANKRQQMINLLDKQTTAGIIRIMEELNKRTDDAADLVYMAAFHVLGSRIGWEKAEEYSDNIMMGGAQ